MNLEILPSAREDLAEGFAFFLNETNGVFIHAVLDCRRNPAWIRQQMKGR